MESTSVMNITTTWLQPNTTDNSSQTILPNNTTPTPHVRPRRSEWILDVRRRYIPIIVIAIPANLGLIVFILCSKDMRTKTFFLGVLSLSIYCLCEGVFTLPMGMVHELNPRNWQHGDYVCAAYSVMYLMKTFMFSLMNITLCLERLVAKLRSVLYIRDVMAANMSKILVLIPWVVGLLTAVPLLVFHRKDLRRYTKDKKLCVFALEEEFHIPGVAVLYTVPLVMLLVISITMFLIYKLKKTEWNRIALETEAEEASLRMSTLSVWIVSLAFVGFHAPNTASILKIVYCKTQACYPTYETYLTSIFLTNIPTAIVPFFWIMTVEVRAMLASIKNYFADKIGKRNRPPVLTLSSLHEKSGADNTA